MSSTLSELLDCGFAAQQSGRLDDALSYYQAAFELAPEDAEVLSLLGLVFTQLNRFTDAEPLLRDAVAREPHEMGFRMNLAELLTRVSSFEDAKTELSLIVSQNPDFPPALEKLGDIALLEEDMTAALEKYKKAYSLSSNNFNLGLKLAKLYISLQDYDPALHMLDRLTTQYPKHPAPLNLLCLIYLARKDWRQLQNKANSWTSLSPDDAVAWQLLSTAFMEQGHYSLAEQAHRKVLTIRPENAEDLSIHGHICMQCFEYDLAKSVLHRAEVLEPERVELLVSLSLLHTYYGDFEKAEDYCRRALKIEPGCVPAYTQLGHLRRGKLSDKEISQLVNLQNEPGQSLENRSDIAFTLGRAYEIQQKYEPSFKAYQLANQLNQDLGKSLNLSYDNNSSSIRTQQIKTLYASTSNHIPLKSSKPDPIFIVGMPRSGTTLLESVIAAHSKVFAGGERPLLAQMNNSILSTSSPANLQLPSGPALEELRKNYLSDLPDIGTASFFTDKNPLNIEAVGLIDLLFPTAAIVHIRRNPVETCLSIFKHKFSKFWTFSHALADIAHFYTQYAQLVSHWENSLGDRFLTIQYEDFADKFSTMAPLLISHCGLEWETQCLSFQSDKRAISTLSSIQIRQEVKASPALAGNYQPFIQLLLEVLSSANIDLKTGAWTRPGN